MRRAVESRAAARLSTRRTPPDPRRQCPPSAGPRGQARAVKTDRTLGGHQYPIALLLAVHGVPHLAGTASWRTSEAENSYCRSYPRSWTLPAALPTGDHGPAGSRYPSAGRSRARSHAVQVVSAQDPGLNRRTSARSAVCSVIRRSWIAAWTSPSPAATTHRCRVAPFVSHKENGGGEHAFAASPNAVAGSVAAGPGRLRRGTPLPSGSTRPLPRPRGRRSSAVQSPASTALVQAVGGPAGASTKGGGLAIPASFWRSLILVAVEVLGTWLGGVFFPDGGRRRRRHR